MQRMAQFRALHIFCRIPSLKFILLLHKISSSTICTDWWCLDYCSYLPGHNDVILHQFKCQILFWDNLFVILLPNFVVNNTSFNRETLDVYMLWWRFNIPGSPKTFIVANNLKFTDSQFFRGYSLRQDPVDGSDSVWKASSKPEASWLIHDLSWLERIPEIPPTILMW